MKEANVKFLCGKFYNGDISDLRNEIAEDINNRFELMISEYLQEIYDNESSIQVQWNLYFSNILPFEKALNKYVWQFSVEELEDMLLSIPSNSPDVKLATYSFVYQYIDWVIATKDDLITWNLMKSINRDRVTTVAKKALIRKVIGLNEFWNNIAIMESKVNYNNILPLVFARYGLMGSDVEHIINASLESIDRENMLYITLDKGNNIITVPIDNRFINFCNKVSNYNREKKGKGYVLQTDVLADSTIYGRIRKAEIETGIKMKLNDLYRSRILDFLLDIRRERKLVAPDFQNIILMFYPNSSAGRYSSLVKFYENLTHDKVYMRYEYKNLEELEDSNGSEFINDLREELNFY